MGNDTNVKTTQTKALPNARALKIRVHNIADRLEIHEIVKKVAPTYTTFCYRDLATEELNQTFAVQLDGEFPEYYLETNKSYHKFCS